MRVTANRLVDLATEATSRNESRVADLSNEITSGLRVSDPSQDPTAWVAAQRAKVHAALADGAAAATAAGTARLNAIDNAVAQIENIVTQVRTLAVQGASASYDASSRAGIGTQVSALFSAAVAAANAQDPNGEYILAGAQSLAAPFAANGSYNGDATARAVPTAEAATQLATVAGSQLTAANGVDVLPLIGQVASALATNNVAALQSTLPDLETAVQQLARIRTDNGGMLAALDQATSAHAQLAVQLQSTISRLVESDTVGAASDLAKANQALQVSQAVSTKMLALLAPQS